MALRPPLLTERVDDEWGGLVLPRLRSVCLGANSLVALTRPACFCGVSPSLPLTVCRFARRGLGAGRFCCWPELWLQLPHHQYSRCARLCKALNGIVAAPLKTESEYSAASDQLHPVVPLLIMRCTAYSWAAAQ